MAPFDRVAAGVNAVNASMASLRSIAWLYPVTPLDLDMFAVPVPHVDRALCIAPRTRFSKPRTREHRPSGRAPHRRGQGPR